MILRNGLCCSPSDVGSIGEKINTNWFIFKLKIAYNETRSTHRGSYSAVTRLVNLFHLTILAGINYGENNFVHDFRSKNKKNTSYKDMSSKPSLSNLTR